MLKVSIIISTYNAAKTLKQTLDSIKYQTYSNIELIIVDGKSIDGTIDIIKEYNNIITKWISEPDTGIYNAWNKALNFVTGDYVAFIGADDCYCSYNVIENIVKNIDKGTVVLSAPIFLIDEKYRTQRLLNNKKSKAEILAGEMISHPGMFVKTEVLKKYKFNESNKIISDYEFLLQYILNNEKIKFIDIPIVYFSDSGISSNSVGTEMWATRIYEHILLFEKYNLEKKYLIKFFENNFQFKNNDKFTWHFKEIIKLILKKLNLFSFIKYNFTKSEKHKCNLKYCRWCGRTDSK